MSKELYSALDERGLLGYGEHISGDDVREIIGIEYPEVASKKEFDQLALIELQAIDYVRNILLGQGKYLAGVGGDYRILLPSENMRQVEQYMGQADKKLKRALKLSRNSPKLDTARPSNIDARITMKLESIRSFAA